MAAKFKGRAKKDRIDTSIPSHFKRELNTEVFDNVLAGKGFPIKGRERKQRGSALAVHHTDRKGTAPSAKTAWSLQ